MANRRLCRLGFSLGDSKRSLRFIEAGKGWSYVPKDWQAIHCDPARTQIPLLLLHTSETTDRQSPRIRRVSGGKPRRLKQPLEPRIRSSHAAHAAGSPLRPAQTSISYRRIQIRGRYGESLSRVLHDTQRRTRSASRGGTAYPSTAGF